MSYYQCQMTAIDELNLSAKHDTHSIIIEGCPGSGKTYLASQFSNMLDESVFVVIDPTVSDIRKMICDTSLISNKTTLCIENLDTGVPAAAYAILKVLEEPQPNLYLIITCRNLQRIPATIISRSTVISVSSPTPNDILAYAKQFAEDKRAIIMNSMLWPAARSFQDISMLFTLPADKLQYLADLQINFNQDNISTVMWNLGHYPDNTETNISFVLRMLMIQSTSKEVRNIYLDAVNDIEENRVASHAVIAKLLLTLKYAV